MQLKDLHLTETYIREALSYKGLLTRLDGSTRV